MRLVNQNLVGVTRNLIQSQGGNPWMITDSGELDPAGALSLLFNEVEVRTSVTPPIRFPTGPSGPPMDSATDSLMRSLKPTVIFSGPAGRVEIAPYGTEVAQSWTPVLVVGGIGLAIAAWLVFGGR